MAIYYMRDNHTFKKLSSDPDKAMQELELEFEAGWEHGMLCSKDIDKASLHARGRKFKNKFFREAREWLTDYKQFNNGAGI